MSHLKFNKPYLTQLLDENIQTELDRLAGLDWSDSAPMDPSTEPGLEPVRSAIQQAAQSCRARLDQQRKRLRRTDSALAELERFLGSLQQAGSDLSHLLSASSAMQEDSSMLTPIQRRAQEAIAEAPRIDTILGDAGLKVTLDGALASGLEVARALGRRVEEAQARVSQPQRGHERGGQREEQRDGEKERELSHRRRALQDTLKEMKGGAERLGLKEPTLPALQQRYHRRKQ